MSTMRILLIALLVCSSFSCSDQQWKRVLEGAQGPAGLSSTEVAAGLREALTIGANQAAGAASMRDGFFKNPALFIPFPEEAIKVKNTALTLGLGSQVTRFEETLNRAAEEASKQAAPILVNAITSMGINDAFAILRGDNNAATNYLRTTTEAALLDAFRPRVQDAVDAVELTKYWQPLASAYNTATTFTGGQSVNPDLTGYVTEKALNGLFVLVAQEEAHIRENPAARVTDLLKKVFGSPETGRNK
jgi:hypothetical protein